MHTAAGPLACARMSAASPLCGRSSSCSVTVSSTRTHCVSTATSAPSSASSPAPLPAAGAIHSGPAASTCAARVG